MHDTSEEALWNSRTDTVEESPVHVGLDVHKESIAVAVARHVADIFVSSKLRKQFEINSAETRVLLKIQEFFVSESIKVQ